MVWKLQNKSCIDSLALTEFSKKYLLSLHVFYISTVERILFFFFKHFKSLDIPSSSGLIWPSQASNAGLVLTPRNYNYNYYRNTLWPFVAKPVTIVIDLLFFLIYSCSLMIYPLVEPIAYLEFYYVRQVVAFEIDQFYFLMILHIIV